MENLWPVVYYGGLRATSWIALGILYIYIHTYPTMARLVDLFLNGVTLGSGIGVSCDGWIEYVVWRG